MKLRLATQVSIVLLAVPVLACSMLRARQPLHWHVTLEIDESVQDRDAATKRAVTVLENRLNAFGVPYFEVKALGTPLNGRILVSLPNVADSERIKKLLSSEGRLELSHVISPASPAMFKTYATKEEAIATLGDALPPNRLVLLYSEPASRVVIGGPKQRWIVVDANAIVDGSELRNATAISNRGDPENYSVLFSLRPNGAERFGTWTRENINEYLAVIYNGEVKSVVYIKSQISDQGEISGRFTKPSAEDIALILNSGALPKVKIVEEGSNK